MIWYLLGIMIKICIAFIDLVMIWYHFKTRWTSDIDIIDEIDYDFNFIIYSYGFTDNDHACILYAIPHNIGCHCHTHTWNDLMNANVDILY